MNDLTELLNAIKSEINTVVERHLLPHFERMKCNNENIKMIETVLQQMPAFQKLERENEELKKLLKTTKEDVERHVPTACAPVCDNENIIKLEIVESVANEIVSESEIYKNANVSDKLTNQQIKAEPIEEETEAEEEEEEASEVEEETEVEEEAEASEAEASEAEEEEEEEEVEEDGVEGAEPLEEEEEEAEEEEDGVEGAESLEEEASEAEEEAEEEEEASEAEEEEEDGVEGAEPLEEEGVEDGVEGAEPLEEEEVSLIEIKGRGKFYTNNPVSGDIYKVDPDEEVGDQIGKFVKGVPIFF